jgi:GT2 family glycosyltransferase
LKIHLREKSMSLTRKAAISNRLAGRHVDIVAGCFLLIDRLLWDKPEGFDPRFFMYGEEADLCQRARSLGARPALTPEATVVHYGRASDIVPVDKRIKVFKGRITLINRHFGWPARQIGQALHLIAPLARLWLRNGSRRGGEFEMATECGVLAGSLEARSEWGNGYQTYSGKPA